MGIAKYLLIIPVVLTALLLAHAIKPGGPLVAERAATERPAHPPILSPPTALWMLEQARTQFARGTSTALPISSAPPEATRPGPEKVFLTIYPETKLESNLDRVGNRCTSGPLAPTIGRGPNLASALHAAISTVLAANASAAQRSSIIASRAYRIKIDVVTGTLDNLDSPADSRMTAAELIDVGSQGIEVGIGGSEVYLLPAELIYAHVAESSESETAEELLDRAMSYLGFQAGRWRSRDVTLRAFRTVSFVEDASHTRALGLERGYARAGSPDRRALLTSARNAGDYLVRMQRSDGSFSYWYRPLLDQVEGGHYNIVRHAGACISLFDLYQATRDSRYLAPAHKAMAFLRTRFTRIESVEGAGSGHDQPESQEGTSRPSSSLFGKPGLLRVERGTPPRPAHAVRSAGPALYVLDDDKKAKLGAGGLALLAVTRELELDHRFGSSEANELARGIMAMQRPDGSFETDITPSGEQSDPPSLYYPGEAMLGLMRLYKLNRDRRLLDAARRGADYLVAVQRSQRELPPDAWLVQALECIFEMTKDARYAEHAVDVAASMAASLYPADAPEGYEGAVAPGIPRVTPAASRSEGMLAGYRVARATRDPRAERVLEAARAPARFQLSQQFNPDNSFFLPNPARAAGGFHESLDSTRIRIDYVQHNISSLLALAEVTDR